MGDSSCRPYNVRLDVLQAFSLRSVPVRPEWDGAVFYRSSCRLSLQFKACLFEHRIPVRSAGRSILFLCATGQ